MCGVLLWEEGECKEDGMVVGGVALPRRRPQKNMDQFGVLTDVGNDFSDSGGGGEKLTPPTVAATRIEQCLLLTNSASTRRKKKKENTGPALFA